MEKISEFKNNNNQRLIGIIHIPENNLHKNKVGIVMLNAGLVDKAGPHRLYVKIARKLCNKGYYILRFDSFGLGESEGELKKGYNVEIFALIQQGLFVEDTLSSINYFKKELKLEKIIMTGLCGGAATALLAASKDNRIDGLILMDPPVYLDNSNNINKKSVHPFEVENSISSYTKKIFQLKTWLRFITLQIDYSGFWRTIREYLKLRLKSNKTDQYVNKDESFILERPLNKLFLNAFLTYMSTKREILFILGDNDSVAWEFKNKFQDKFLNSELYKPYLEIINVETANHDFQSLRAQDILLNKISTWLDKQYH